MRKAKLVSSFIFFILKVSNPNVPFPVIGFLSFQTNGHDLNDDFKYLQIQLIQDEVP